MPSMNSIKVYDMRKLLMGLHLLVGRDADGFTR